MVKLLACGARGPGFDSRPRHLNFQIGYLLLPSGDMTERSLNTTNQPTIFHINDILSYDYIQMLHSTIIYRRLSQEELRRHLSRLSVLRLPLIRKCTSLL